MSDDSAMPAPHRMHLRGPWEFEWIEEFSPSEALLNNPVAAPTGRVKMPADWQTAFGNRAGTVRLRRRFGRPTNLDLDERVFIVFDGVGGVARISVNGVLLGTIENSTQTLRFEITTLLEASNLLEVELTYSKGDEQAHPGGLWAPVAIEGHQS